MITLCVAVYAAVISTFVLGWDVYKWLDAGPKVQMTATGGMRIVGNGHIDPNSYVGVTANNLGDRATTITNLGFLFYDSWAKAASCHKRPEKPHHHRAVSRACHPIPIRARRNEWALLYRTETYLAWRGAATYMPFCITRTVGEGYGRE